MQIAHIAGNVGKDATLRRPRKTAEEIASMLDYDPETGIFTWAVRGPDDFTCAENERTRVASRWNKLRAGKQAGCLDSNGYRVICIEGKTYRAQRVAIAIVTGKWPEQEVDHINHDRDDNSFANLREVSASENSRNRSLPANNTSGAIGVNFHRPSGKWRALIFVDGQKRHLGSFDLKEDAEAARAAASAEHNFHINHGRKGIAA